MKRKSLIAILIVLVVMLCMSALAACVDNPDSSDTSDTTNNSGEITFIIKFETNGGTVIEDIVFTDVSTFKMPEDPKKDNFEFAGWYLDADFTNVFSKDSMTKANITLYAKWNENLKAEIVSVDGATISDKEISMFAESDTEKIDLTTVVRRYVLASSFSRNGLRRKKRNEALTEVNRKKADLEADFHKKTKLENLSCYNELVALKEQILSDNEKASTMIIGKPLSDEETDYRFLIGFKKSDISKEALNFAVKTLGVPEKALSGVPVFFEPKTRNGVIVVRADRDYYKAAGGDDFGIIRKIYFSLLSSLGPKNLKLGGAETAIESVVGAVADRVKAKLGENYLYDKDKGQRQSGNVIHYSACGRERSQSFRFVNPQKI